MALLIRRTILLLTFSFVSVVQSLAQSSGENEWTFFRNFEAIFWGADSPESICQELMGHARFKHIVNKCSVEESASEHAISVKLQYVSDSVEFAKQAFAESYLRWRMLGFSRAWTERMLFDDKPKPSVSASPLLVEFSQQTGIPSNFFRPAPHHLASAIISNPEQKVYIAEDAFWMVVVHGGKGMVDADCWIMDRNIINHPDCINVLVNRRSEWEEAITHSAKVAKMTGKFYRPWRSRWDEFARLVSPLLIVRPVVNDDNR